MNNNVFNKKIFRYFIKEIGGNGFQLYFYYKMFNEKDITEFKAAKIVNDLGMSKKTLRNYNEKMMSKGIILFERVKIGGEEFLKVKINKKVVFEKNERTTVSYIYTNTNKSNRSSKKTNKVLISNYTSTNKYYKAIKRTLLSHGRFKHNIYISRFKRIDETGTSNKELNNLKRLEKNIKLEDVEKYTLWWIKYKFKGIAGFSFGIFAYEEHLMEFLIKIKKIDPYKKVVKKDNDKAARKRRISSIKKKVTKMDLKNLKEYEWDILRTAAEFELVEIKGKKVKILF